jgi:hypothetical protein
MALDLSNASNVLKTRYIGPVRDQLNNSTILLSRIAREEGYVDVSGKSFTVPLHTGRNKSAGHGRADGGTLPTAGQQSYAVAVVPNSYQYGRIEITGPTIAATKDNAGSFIRAVESEIDGLTKDTKKAFNRQMHGDGRDALAFWTGADDTSGTTVDDSRGNAFVYLQAGTTTCDLIDASDNSTKLGDSIVVTLGAKAAANYAVTWTGTVSGSADSDYLVLEDTLGAQLMGIEGIIDDGNPALLSGGLHGIDATAAANAYWQAQVVTGDTEGTNQALTLERMQLPLDLIAQNSDFDENAVKFMLCSYGVRAKYVSLLVSDKRHVNTMELDGGFKAVDFNGIPLVPDPQCKKNRIYYVSPETLKIFRTQDFDWMEKDGAVLSRVANKDAYEATLFHYGNLGCIARNGNGLLIDITE